MQFPVLASRIQIPTPDPSALPRRRSLGRYLTPQTRLALVTAGAGFGKTQWAAAWAAELEPAPAWLTLGHREDDAHSLLVYLRAGWLRVCPECDSSALDALLRQGFAPERWRPVADHLGVLFEGPPRTYVVDDVHHLQGEAAALLEYLIQFGPANLGWVLLTRQAPDFEFLEHWKLRGWVTEIGAEELRFSASELAEQNIAWTDVESTGGWPLAIDAWRRTGLKGNPEKLFLQVWKAQPEGLQELLTRASVLEFLHADQVAELCPHLETREMLRQAADQGIFLQRYGPDEYRFHPLARSFLLNQLRGSQALSLTTHRAAAPFALAQGDYDEALWHLFEAGATEEAAGILAHWAPALLEQGSLAKVLQYVEQLPEESRDPRLRLIYAQALARSHYFEKALQEFTRLAQQDTPVRSQALLGAGKVLVDTLQPIQAHQMLRQAYRGLSREDKVQVLWLLAENCLNQGSDRKARRYRRLAGGEGQSSDRLEPRLMLRSGNLDLAREALLREADGQGTGHKNDALLLAYLAVLQGDASSAELLTRSALRQAQHRHERFAEAVAWMRLGHALQLKANPQQHEGEIRSCYVRARQLTQEMGMPRLQAEALMGEALFCAHNGEWARSYDAALQGLELTRSAGDAWLSAWLQLVCAIAARQGEHPGWADLFEAARVQFEMVHDRFGSALVRLWTQGEAARPALREEGYEFLLERPTFFGLRTGGEPLPGQSVAPAAERPRETSASAPLRLCLLGPIQVFRNGEEVPHKLWKRKKAKELLGILLSLRGGFISKERLWDLLFPDSTPQAAARDLRVLLHALFEVLDPDRPHNATARCVVRRDDHYSLPWTAEVSIDLLEFERFVQLGLEAGDPESAAHLWQRALDLVRGDYLQEFPYADWAAASREQWKGQYLDTASRLAQYNLELERWEQVSQIAHLMLQRDRCWEEGYQLLMKVHLSQTRLAQAARVYDQCRQALEEDLGVEPSEKTEELYALALT